jgi:hypothetical protein
MTTIDITYVVPMYESVRGWGSKLDGYAGPFDTLGNAKAFQTAYNTKNNPPMDVAPDWYIVALEPEIFTGQTCDYSKTVVA